MGMECEGHGRIFTGPIHEKGGILGSEIGWISALLLLASMKVWRGL